ncbi:hypothetical protein BDE40_3071 [Litoreibacter halocynthiae]|uniref:Uncharacterized protein n=1 Tax=Litoreibacter halocynthiae TaxID=1242689 RepID=A0A4R7LF40_9RHOB|nr:hypothetical protein BDE40_3071 [Litoreibacter halocynthiae]
MLHLALNRMTASNSPFEEFFDVAEALGCVGVKLHNQFATGLFDAGGAECAGLFLKPDCTRQANAARSWPRPSRRAHAITDPRATLLKSKRFIETDCQALAA